MNESPDISLLIDLLEEGFQKKAWHGSNLKGSIKGLTSDQAAWRPADGRHNIWEIVLHTAYWKYTVRRRLLGEQRGSFPLKGSNWFLRPLESTEAAWKKDVQILNGAHKSLVEALRHLDSSTLYKIPKGGKLPNIIVVRGIAMHDVYHAGQIQILKRLMKERSS